MAMSPLLGNYDPRAPNLDELERISQDVSRGYSGYVYVTDQNVSQEIKSAYEAADTGLLERSQVTRGEIRSALNELATDEGTALERVRNGVFFYNVFGQPDNVVGNAVRSVFENEVVVSEERLRNELNVATEDLDDLVSRLTAQNYVDSIHTGNKTLYIVGNGLEADTKGGVQTFQQRLVARAQEGLVKHKDLQRIIGLDATESVISYLEDNEFILDLDGEYLVLNKDEIASHARALAKDIAPNVLDEMSTANYALPLSEYEQVLGNEISANSDVLTRGRKKDVGGVSVAKHCLSNVKQSLANPELTRDHRAITVDDNTGAKDVAVVEDEFAELIEGEVESLLDLSLPIDKEKALQDVEEQLEDRQILDDEMANEWAKSRITDRAKDRLDEVV
jgi:hypothetical protein